MAGRNEGTREQLECPRKEGFCKKKKEDYLNKRDSVKVEVEELELMMSPEDSEVHLRYILMNASRRSSNIFGILITKERKKGALCCKQSATGATPETEGRDEL